MASNTPISLNKFSSAQTALNILREQTLHWSAPHLFNDPFELNAETKLPFNSNDLINGAVLEACAMIFSREAPKGSSSFVNAIRRWRTEERFHSQEEAEEVLKGLLPTMVKYHEEMIKEVISDWKKFSSSLRICCFVHKHNSMAAWQRYGDNHSGVALRFKCGSESTLEEPRQVLYLNKRQEITSTRDQLAIMIGGSTIRPQDSFYEKFLSKAATDKQEREWRAFKEVSGEELLSDILKVPFVTEELTGVFFGIGTTLPNRQAIFDLCKENYVKTKIYQAVLIPGQFDIDYVKLTARPEK